MKIYAGNLSFDTTEKELREEFTSFGTVDSVSLPTDKYTGRPRGFAFIEMPSSSEGQAAIAALNGKSLQNRTLVVNVAKPRTNERGDRPYGDRRGGGFGGARGRRY
jgi:RNA recognition motif-containing protein